MHVQCEAGTRNSPKAEKVEKLSAAQRTIIYNTVTTRNCLPWKDVNSIIVQIRRDQTVMASKNGCSQTQAHRWKQCPAFSQLVL